MLLRINYKKEERMAVAAKVIETIRLGLVDIKDVIRELNTEEMQRVPEIHMLVYQCLLYSYIPSSSTFGIEKVKIRSTGPVSRNSTDLPSNLHSNAKSL